MFERFLPITSLCHLFDTLLDVLDILADLVPSLGFGDNIPHLPKESFGALSAWGIRALDAYKEGVHDVLHVVGQHAGIMGPDLDQLANLLRRQLADAAEGSLNALELFCEELDVLLCSLLQVVLILEQLAELGKQSAQCSGRELHGC